jgi:hypothetical protein
MLLFKKIFSPKNLATKFAFLVQNTANAFKNWIVTLVSKKSDMLFRRRWAKIAKNCDHNIDPYVCRQLSLFVSYDVKESFDAAKA